MSGKANQKKVTKLIKQFSVFCNRIGDKKECELYNGHPWYMRFRYNNYDRYITFYNIIVLLNSKIAQLNYNLITYIDKLFKFYY